MNWTNQMHKRQTSDIKCRKLFDRYKNRHFNQTSIERLKRNYVCLIFISTPNIITLIIWTMNTRNFLENCVTFHVCACSLLCRRNGRDLIVIDNSLMPMTIKYIRPNSHYQIWTLNYRKMWLFAWNSQAFQIKLISSQWFLLLNFSVFVLKCHVSWDIARTCQMNHWNHSCVFFSK